MCKIDEGHSPLSIYRDRDRKQLNLYADIIAMCTSVVLADSHEIPADRIIDATHARGRTLVDACDLPQRSTATIFRRLHQNTVNAQRNVLDSHDSQDALAQFRYA